MRLFILTALFLGVMMPKAFAGEIVIKVNGMVCDFCAQAIWKVFEEYEAVDSIDVDLDAGEVTVALKEGQDLSDEELHKGIRYAGYDLVDVRR